MVKAYAVLRLVTVDKRMWGRSPQKPKTLKLRKGAGCTEACDISIALA